MICTVLSIQGAPKGFGQLKIQIGPIYFLIHRCTQSQSNFFITVHQNARTCFVSKMPFLFHSCFKVLFSHRKTTTQSKQIKSSSKPTILSCCIVSFSNMSYYARTIDFERSCWHKNIGWPGFLDSWLSFLLTAHIVRSRQWCEMMPCLDDEGCDLLVNRSGWTCAQPSGRVKTTTVSAVNL